MTCGAVFLHIPKTGGSWVTDALRAQNLIAYQFGHIHADLNQASKHLDIGAALSDVGGWAKRFVPMSWKKSRIALRAKHRQRATYKPHMPPTFCFVRHPLRWYESFWRYMRGRAGDDWSQEPDLLHPWHPCAPLRMLGHADFRQFVRNVNREQPGFVTQMYARYAQGETTIVGKQENLVEDLGRILKRLAVGFDEHQLRQSERINVSDQRARLTWSDELREETHRLEYAGLVRYGYESLT